MKTSPHSTPPVAAGSRWILWLAQGFGSGLLPKAPGTWGSGVGIVWALALWSLQSPLIYLVATLGATFLSVPICNHAARCLGCKDPASVVLDEIIALPYALGGWLLVNGGFLGPFPPLPDLPGMALPLGGAFVLFRIFDISKWGWIDRAQRLPGGWGIVADDVAAGLSAGVVLAGIGAVIHWMRSG